MMILLFYCNKRFLTSSDRGVEKFYADTCKNEEKHLLEGLKCAAISRHAWVSIADNSSIFFFSHFTIYTTGGFFLPFPLKLSSMKTKKKKTNTFSCSWKIHENRHKYFLYFLLLLSFHKPAQLEALSQVYRHTHERERRESKAKAGNFSMHNNAESDFCFLHRKKIRKQEICFDFHVSRAPIGKVI